jgi:hypothetical protein
MAIQEMIRDKCDEVVLEAEICNAGALKLYQVAESSMPDTV